MKANINIDKLLTELAIHRSQSEVAKLYGISKQALNMRLKSLGIKIENQHKFRVKKVGDTFFIFRKNGQFIGKFNEDCIERHEDIVP